MAVSQGISEELTCSICLETYSNPVTLPCAHTFCRQCLVNVQERTIFRRSFRNNTNTTNTNTNTNNPINNIINSADGPSTDPPPCPDKITCPHCRVDVVLGPGGVNALPKNTTLANIILSLEEEKKARNVVCEVCDDDPPRNAAKICSDCYVTYCMTCFRQLHPMRGSFKYHVIKEANQTAPPAVIHATSPVLERATASGRFTPSLDFTDAESGDEGGAAVNQDILERIRKQIKSKRKELTSALKNVQAMLKSTEEDTEERMREVRSMCCEISECVSEREASLLTAISQQRHETVRQCVALTGEVKGCTGRLDLLEDQVNDVTSCTSVYSGTDIGNDATSLQTKLSEIHTRALISKSKKIQRQPRIADNVISHHIQALDFVRDNVLVTPEFTSFEHKPVWKGPALVTVGWEMVQGSTKYKLSATHKDSHGHQVTMSVLLDPSSTSYQLTLPLVDTEHCVSLEVTSRELTHPVISRTIRTLPYVHSMKIRFNATTCHKKVAVSLTKDELVHRKCKLASLHNACLSTTSSQRLDTLEGATADECLPVLPHVYWQHVIHFQVFGRLVNSRLLCDIGVCKQGSEDHFTPLCDNFNSYATYLVRRNTKICLEFWNGTNRENLSRSIPVLDLDTDNDKTIKLGFYYNAIRKTFAVISPANNSVLCKFKVKFASILPVYALYSTDQVFVVIRNTEAVKLPTVLATLMTEG